MFWIFVVFHIIIFLEVYLLYKKKMPKKSILLCLLNIVLATINITKLTNTLNKTVSSIILLQKNLVDHTIINLLWIILNIIFIIFLHNCIKQSTQKKVQNKKLKHILYCLEGIIIFYLLTAILTKSLTLLIFIAIIGAYYYLIKKFKKTRENSIIIISIILSFLTFIFYFTDIGAVRFQILLNGYIKETYETGIEELKYPEEKNSKIYSVVETIPLKEGYLKTIEVKKYGIIKIGKIRD